MSSKKYMLSWIALIDYENGSHEHKTIEHVKEFASLKEAMDWAKSKLSIEVVECDSKGNPLAIFDHKNVSSGYWCPE